MKKAVMFVYLLLSLPSVFAADVNDLLQAINRNSVEEVKSVLIDGADPNNEEIFIRVFFIDLEMAEFLFNNNYRKIDPKTFCQFLKKNKWRAYQEEQGMTYFFTRPNMILDLKYRNLNVVAASAPKIPPILHHIWLTNEKQKRGLLKEDFENVLKTHEIFMKGDIIWRHIVWTNDKNLIPKSVEMLEKNGIEVREIGGLKENFKLGKKIEELIENGRWCMASDSLRYELVNYLGGVYADLNYIFARNVGEEIHKYDFFSQTYEKRGDISINNFIFGAKPGHPVLQELIELVYKNFYDPSDFIRSLKGRSVTDETTAVPTGPAYYRAANKNGTIDVIYPYIDFNDLSDQSSQGEFRLASDEKIFQEEVIKQRSRIIKKYTDCVEGVDYIDKVMAFYDYLGSREICGTKRHLIGEDSKDGATWVNPEYDY